MAKCSKTRHDGQPCGAHALTGRDVCAGHARLGVSGDPLAYAADGGRAKAAKARERAALRKETLLEKISRQTEEKAAEIVGAYFAAGERGDWRALEALVTRVHGKPVERVAVETDPDPFGVQAMTSAERSALVARVLASYPELEPGTPLVHTAALDRMDAGNTPKH